MTPATGGTATTTIGDFLLRRLREAGIAHAFGVPGDYNLEFLQQIEDSETLTWIGTCDELNAAYAADGYARLSGLGLVVVTNGVGALSAMNGIAGAYCEHVPVIRVCGGLPLVAREQDRLMHHTLADGGRDEFIRAYAQVTAAQTRITPQNAVAEIDRVLRTAWLLKLPVYLELPSDVAYLDIEAPAEPLRLTTPISDHERLASSSRAIADRLVAAKAPAVLIDLDAERFGAVSGIIELAERLNLPIAAVLTAKGVIDETLPCYIGLYDGAGSSPSVRAAIENSDCLLSVGYRRVDTTSGYFSDNLPADTIQARAYSVDVGGTNYQAVTLKELIQAVIADVTPHPGPVAFPRDAGAAAAAIVPATATTASGALTQAELWQTIQGYVGSLLGTLFAAPARRQLLVVGDGSFQLTAQELSTILRHDLSPTILLVNNSSYTLERAILGKSARYNDVAGWAYSELPGVLRPDGNALTFRVETVEDLHKALGTDHDGLVFIEAVLGPDDASAGLISAGHASANLDYGPRGPQGRPGAQL